MTEPNWYPDPTEPDRMRWWDGKEWTNRVSEPVEAPVFTKNDYRHFGQIHNLNGSLKVESAKYERSSDLNAAKIPPTGNPENVASEIINHTPEVKTQKGKKTLLAIALIASLGFAGVALVSFNQDKNSIPTQTEIISLSEGIGNSPDIIGATISYEPTRNCDGYSSCLPYRATVASASSFTAESFESLVKTIAHLKSSTADLQVCMSDDILDPSLQKPADFYADTMSSSNITQSQTLIQENAACTIFTGQYMYELATDM